MTTGDFSSGKESEHTTRKKRIDIKLKSCGWLVVPMKFATDESKLTHHAVEEYPTDNGPADYALFVDGKIYGIIEAKKVKIGAQNVLEQAKRYAKGLNNSIGKWQECKVPFLYSTNGELIYFLDVRNKNNLSRQISTFHTPESQKAMFSYDQNVGFKWLEETPVQTDWLRYYQKDAIISIEQAIMRSNRRMMIAMATGTGKTSMAVAGIYRLLKSKTAKKILFLVDRKSLAAQTVQSFSAFGTPEGYKFDKEYELYSQKFRKEDFEDEKFDSKVLPNEYLTNPDTSKTFVYISTIQRMAINLLGKKAVFDNQSGDEDEDEDAKELNIPINAFDVIIADECHRGYTSKDTNVWRSVLEHFDAVKIGLTATPAAHTIAYFGDPIYKYGVEKAIQDGFLVDYDAVKINSEVKIKGAFLQEGEQVEIIDVETGEGHIDQLEDEREFDTAKIEHEITVPESNKKIIQEYKKYALEFEKEKGRFPKTLIFAVNDIEHISHADQIVRICKDEFGRGDDFVKKITGSPSVDRPLQRIKEFRNRQEPGIVVTVDMLSTGVDIPALEFIVFMRPVKSRILWEQMLGRGTRLCPEINKDRFTIFDCFNGGLIEYFKNVSNFKINALLAEPLTIIQVIEKIYKNEDREYYTSVLVKRLRRIEKSMSGEAQEDFAKFIPEGDVGKFASDLPGRLKNDFTQIMKLLMDKDFQKLLLDYKRPKKVFIRGLEVEDDVSSEVIIRLKDKDLKPKEYLEAFTDFIKANADQMTALEILLNKPEKWNTSVLENIRQVLNQNDFKINELEKAHKIVYHKELVDLISMIKHAANNEKLLSAEERVNRALEKIFEGKKLTEEQVQWLEHIKQHLIKNLTLDIDDFDLTPVFEMRGGLGIFKKVFTFQYRELVKEINKNIAL